MDVMAVNKMQDESITIIIRISKDGQSHVECVGNTDKLNKQVANVLMKHRTLWMLLLKVDELLGKSWKTRIWN